MNPEMAVQEARAIGIEEDFEMDNLFQIAAPTGRFSANALNSLVGAFNEVLVTMGIPEPYPDFQSGERSLPGDLVKGLAMIADATEAAGIKNPVDLDDVTDDTDLEMLAGKLMNLAADEDFAEKMTAGPEPTEMPAPEMGMEEEIVEDDDDALFMQRM